MLHKLKTSHFPQPPKPERRTDPELPCQDQPPGEKPGGPQPWRYPLACRESPGRDAKETHAGSGRAGSVTGSPASLAVPADASAPGSRPAEPPTKPGTGGQPGNATATARRSQSTPSLLPPPHQGSRCETDAPGGRHGPRVRDTNRALGEFQALAPAARQTPPFIQIQPIYPGRQWAQDRWAVRSEVDTLSKNDRRC